MVVIAVGTLPSSAFALAETLEQFPDATFEVERVVATGADEVLPYVWLSSAADRLAAIERAVREDPTTADVEQLVDEGHQRLYQMTWNDGVRFVVHVLVEQRGTVLSATGTQDGWRLRVLFPERDDLLATEDFCATNDVPLTVERVASIDTAARRGQYGLTEEQYETLVAALDRGYYAVPREVSGETLAAELGISHQALSERLRRGYRNLVANALVVGDDR